MAGNLALSFKKLFYYVDNYSNVFQMLQRKAVNHAAEKAVYPV